MDVSEGSSSIQQEGFLPLNTSVPALVSYSNFTAPDPGLPYRFPVPGEEMVLRLGYGFFRRSVDPVRLRSLFQLSLAVIAEGAAEQDWDGYYPMYPIGRHL